MKNEPLLYYRTKEQIDAYRKMPVEEKLERMEAWMEFFDAAMSRKAKEVRARFNKGEL
jgi:hypothetical protein